MELSISCILLANAVRIFSNLPFKSSTINHFISDDKDEREDGGINADNHTDGKTVDSG